MATNWNLEFLNHNSQRSYPLTENSSKTDLTGSFQITSDFMVGLDLTVPGELADHEKFYIKQLSVFPSGARVLFGYAGTPTTEIAYSPVSFQNFQRNQTFPIFGLGEFEDIQGKLTIGRIAGVASQPGGIFNFDLEASRIEPTVVRNMLRGVSAIRIREANGSVSDWYTGHIELAAGANVRLDVAEQLDRVVITVNAIPGEGTLLSDLCDGEADLGPCISTINGIRPTPNGNFILNADECIGIDPVDHGLVISNTCAEACCSCPELEIITRDLERLHSERIALTHYITTLSSYTTTFYSLVLSSRFGDNSCINCDPL